MLKHHDECRLKRLAFPLGTALLIALPTAAGAQPAEIQSWLDPTLGKQIPRVDYRLTYYPAEPVEGQNTHLQLIDEKLSLFIPLHQDSSNEWATSASVKYIDTDTRAFFPDTGDRFPGALWDVRVGASYRHKFENGWIGGVSMTIGSPSDKPFASIDEVDLLALAMLRVPQGERNAWIFSLVYDTLEETFGGLQVPIPGIAYLWSPSDRFKAVIGIPFTSVEYKPIDDVTLEAQYFPLRRVRARATYRPFQPLRLYVGFDWDNDHYLLADRKDRDDALQYYEKRVSGGVRFDLRHVGFQVVGGYAFDRFYFTGDSYSDRHFNRLDIHPGPFVTGQVSLRF